MKKRIVIGVSGASGIIYAPLNAIHLENLTKLARLGVQIIPPIPAFYSQPKTIEDIVAHQSMKLMDALGIENHVSGRWKDND